MNGMAVVEVCAAFPERVLNACTVENIDVFDLERRDACTLRVSIREAQLGALRVLAEREHAQMKILRHTEWTRLRAALHRRVALLVFLAAGFAAVMLSSLFIWEIDVDGCQTLSEGEVLRALAACGVYEGAFWPGLSQDEIRTQMLLRQTELAWMSVNVSGSRALVTVVERTQAPEIYREENGAELIAAKNGVVSELCVLNGRALVRPGDAVLAGETLVTGRMESIGGETRWVRAAGTVFADTWQELTAVIPDMAEKGECGRTQRRFILRLGKKRMIFSLRSRKELDGYDKIVHEYNLGVRGLFCFPVSVVRETYRLPERAVLAQRDTADCMQRMRESLEEQTDGEILQFHASAGTWKGLPCVTVRAHCRENIAETVRCSP